VVGERGTDAAPEAVLAGAARNSLIVLEDLGDASNVGAMFCNALAFGAGAVFLRAPRIRSIASRFACRRAPWSARWASGVVGHGAGSRIPLFPSAVSLSIPLASGKSYATWLRVLRNAKVTYWKPHTLRHTFASILLSRGAPILSTWCAGGWTNANIFFRVYAKRIEEADVASMSASSSVTPENQRIEQLAQV